MKNVRIYISTKENIDQDKIFDSIKKYSLYLAAIYREEHSQIIKNDHELNRLILELQCNDILVIESIQQFYYLEPNITYKLVNTIRNKKIILIVPQVFDLKELFSKTNSHITYENSQNILLKIIINLSIQSKNQLTKRKKIGIKKAQEKNLYKGRQPNIKLHQNIIYLRKTGLSISKTAAQLSCSISTVKRVWSSKEKYFGYKRATIDYN